MPADAILTHPTTAKNTPMTFSTFQDASRSKQDNETHNLLLIPLLFASLQATPVSDRSPSQKTQQLSKSEAQITTTGRINQRH